MTNGRVTKRGSNMIFRELPRLFSGSSPSAAEGGTPEWVNEDAEDDLDFGNDRYWINGEVLTFEELFAEGQSPTLDAEATVTGGLLTDAAEALFGYDYTYVFDLYTPDAAFYNYAEWRATETDLINLTNWGNAANITRLDSYVPDLSSGTMSAGNPHRIALNLKSNELAISMDGGAVQSGAHGMGAITAVFIGERIKRITRYPLRPNADLDELSAL